MRLRLFDAGARDGHPATVHDRVWTVANAITFVRLLGLPLFVWLLLGPAAHGLAALTLGVVAATDWVDGYVARRFDQVTRLGKLIDPLIDRALLATAAFTLLAVGFLPVLVVVAVVGRDVLLLGAALVRFRGIPSIAVNRAGKLATALLLIGIPAFLLGNMDWDGAPLSIVVAWVTTTVGILAYWYAGYRYVRAALATARR